jgi:uncharacterized protein (TIGR02284 family)
MALPTHQLIEELNDLIRLDRDAIGVYNEAIAKIEEPQIVARLTEFRSDHERHVAELSAIVRRFGGSPPESAGARGIVRKVLTKLAGLVGTEACLKAMESNEEVLNEQYSKRLALDLPVDVAASVERNYANEGHHLEWVKEALRTRSWEHTATIQP